jgi:O-antigen/teichoic acid export membrane protein
VPRVALGEDLRRRNPFPEGTVSVGIGLGVTGVAAYAFLVISARVLGPAEYGGLSVLWALVFLIGGGFFLPLEQEVSRQLVARRVVGQGGAPVIRRALLLGSGLAAVLIAGITVLSPVLTDRLFRGEPLLVLGLILGIVGYMVANLVEGVFSGNGRFGRYGAYLGGEAVLRLAVCVLCAVAGVRTAGLYGLTLGLSPLVITVVMLWGQRDLATPGPEIPWRDISAALGALLVAAVLSQVLINAPPVIVQWLAGPRHKAEVGVFTAALVVARVPLFLFQAVQAALLPKLSGLVAAERYDEFRRGLRRLVAIVAALAAFGTLLGFTIGSAVITRVFGSDFTVSDRTVGMLALGSGAYVVATALAQAIIALGRARFVAVGWGVGCVALLVAVGFGADPVVRVEDAFVAGTLAAVVAMAVGLWVSSAQVGAIDPGHVIEAMNDLPLEP